MHNYWYHLKLQWVWENGFDAHDGLLLQACFLQLSVLLIVKSIHAGKPFLGSNVLRDPILSIGV